MKSKVYSTEGIVLVRRNFGEADRILVTFSKHFGKLRLIAKGVRRPKSRKRGALEVFSKFKFTAARGKNLDIITEAELVNSFNGLRDDLKKASVAYYFCEVVGRLTQDDEKHSDLYRLLDGYLRAIRLDKDLKALRGNFVRDCLVILGFWPKGKKMNNPDYILESITEREMNSKRVAKRILI